MKKLMSLMLALMMLAMCSAMAEGNMQTMTSPDGSYSFEVPADYFSLDSELLMSVYDDEDTRQYMAELLGLQASDQLYEYIAMIEVNNMMFVCSGDMRANVNVQTAETPSTMHEIKMLKSIVDRSMARDYAALGVAEEDITFMEIQQIGGFEWYGIKLKVAGTNMQVMITIVDGVQYVLTFGEFDADVMNHVLETFALADAVE